MLAIFCTCIFLTGGVYTPYSPCMSTPLVYRITKWLSTSRWHLRHYCFSLLAHRLCFRVFYSQCQASQQSWISWNSWTCKFVLKLPWNLKLSWNLNCDLSFSTSVLTLTIVVRAQWQFNVLLAALLICLLHLWIGYSFMFCFSLRLRLCFLCNIALVIVMAPFRCLWLICGT